MSELHICFLHWGKDYACCCVAENRLGLARAHPNIGGFGEHPLRAHDLKHISQKKEHSSFTCVPSLIRVWLKARLILYQNSPGVFSCDFIHSPKIPTEKVHVLVLNVVTY